MKSNAGATIVEFLLSTIIAAVAFIAFTKMFTPLSYQSELTLRTASMYSQYNTVLQALETYVDTSSYNGPIYNVVSCQDLVSAGYLPSNFPCTDTIGETLKGIVINVTNPPISTSPTSGSYNYVVEVLNASQNVVNRYFIAVVGVPQTTNQILENEQINNIAQLNQALYMNALPLTGGFYIVDSNLNARMVGDLVQSFNLSQFTPINSTILSNPLQNQFINLEGKQYFLIYIDANEIMDTQTPTASCQITTTTSNWNDSQQVDQQCNAQNYQCSGSNCTYYVSSSACAVQQPPYSSCRVICNDAPLTIDNYTDTQYYLQCTYPNTNQTIKKYLYDTNQETGTTTEYCNWTYLSC